MRGGSGGLPGGWVCTALEEVCEVNPPRLPDDATEADLVSFVPMAAVEEENGGIDVAATRPLKEVRKGYTQFRSGDVLLAKITPCMENGKLAVVPAMPSSFGYGSTEFFVLRPRRPEFALWIARYLSRRSFRDAARHHMQGAAGQLRVPKKWLQTVDIPVAPLREQHRIVTKLDELFSELDAGVAALERAQVKLERYRASVLKAAVEGRLTERWRQEHPPAETGAELLNRILAERRRRWEEEQLAAFEAKGKKPPKDWKKKYKEPVAPDTEGLSELPEGWCWATVDQLAHFVTSGSRGWAKYYSEEGAAFIRAQDINTDRLILDRVARVRLSGAVEGLRTRVEVGDLLVTITGANVTKAAWVAEDPGEAYVNQHVGLCRMISPAIAPWVHAWHICPSGGRRVLESAAYGAGKPGLGLDDLRHLAVPVPSLQEVLACLPVLEAVRLASHRTSDAIDHGCTRATHLRQSILAHAFAGRLVPQDPDDEPASVLLARIRAEREKAGRAPARGPGAGRRPAARPRPKS